MGDYINRQEAIDAINKALDRETLVNSFVRKVAVDAVKVLPPAQPRWIPMKERRPEKDGRYLCTFQGKAVHICMYLNGCFRLYGYNKDNLITAWMPLPEPYREEEQDD
jgi:hypothetical protein